MGTNAKLKEAKKVLSCIDVLYKCVKSSYSSNKGKNKKSISRLFGTSQAH